MQHQNLFVFDIETIPDTKTAKHLLDLQGDDVAQARQALVDYHLKITDGRNSFLRQPFHQVVAISFLDAEIVRDFSGQEFYKINDIRSGGDLGASEEEIVRGFFAYLKKKTPRLVSFNGKNFDLPVLKYRAMKYEIEAAWLYKSGDKWNNYNQKYSLDWHCDLADAFSDFGASSRIKMNEVCACLNLPGKTGVDGSMVQEYFDQGRLQEIRDYCETDVINTFLLYLSYQHHTGSMTKEAFFKSRQSLVEFLEKNGAERPYLLEFLKEWRVVDARI